MTYDVIVVGAGPAGSVLALQLARAGLKILLLDGSKFPREKVCGEGMMPQGVQILRDLGLVNGTLEDGYKFYGIRYTVPGGPRASAYFPKSETLPEYGVAMRRFSLDEALLGACQAHVDIEVRLRCFVDGLGYGDDGKVEVRGPNLTERASFLVGADGARSTVRRLAGLDWSKSGTQRWAVRAHFEHKERSVQKSQVEVILAGEREMYLTPLSDYETGVIMTLGQDQLNGVQGRPRPAILETLSGSGDGFCQELSQSTLISRVQAIGPLGVPAKSSFGRRLILVGDAAGALDPITGEGLSISLKSSLLAAQTIISVFESGDFGAKPLKAYHRSRLKSIRELSLLTRLVLWLSQHPKVAHKIIANLGEQPQTFSKLLGIAAGSYGVSSLTPRDACRIVLGL